MPQALVRHPQAIRTEADERLARAELRRQIGRLERQLAGLVAEAFPRLAVDTAVPAGSREPRLIGLGGLEQIRDALANRVAEARVALRERNELETRNREVLERMLAAPAEFKWLRISRADVGEPGCGAWHSRPRFGLLGMLMGWWQVKVSSGCPLSGRPAAARTRKLFLHSSPRRLSLVRAAPAGSFQLIEEDGTNDCRDCEHARYRKRAG